MDLGCVLSTDGLVSVSSSEPEPNVLIPSSSFTLESEPSKQRGLFQSGFSKHGRSIVDEENDEYWSRLKTARGDPILSSTNKAATYLLRSGSHSLLSDGEQMLNFSSGKPDAFFFNLLSSSSCSSVHPTFQSLRFFSCQKNICCSFNIGGCYNLQSLFFDLLARYAQVLRRQCICKMFVVVQYCLS